MFIMATVRASKLVVCLANLLGLQVCSERRRYKLVYKFRTLQGIHVSEQQVILIVVSDVVLPRT